MIRGMKKVLIMFGGVSAEHEVSVITGLQVFQNLDRSQYVSYVVRLNKDGLFEYFEGFKKKQDYIKTKPQLVNFGKDIRGGFFQVAGLFKEKIYPDVAYLAFHGGNGESGQMQGFLEILDIPYTSPGVESISLAMNKMMTKQVLASYKIPSVEGISVFAEDVKKDIASVIKTIKIKLPVIIKPVHLGSSIGISIAKTATELKKGLMEAAHVDSEILVEKLMTNFQEYNVSVKKIAGVIKTSEVERPISKDEILSFADKYQRGGKKTGGMAGLSRELPAKISKDLEKKLKEMAIDVFGAIRAKGLVRIDFMVAGKNIYVTEVNPIPGSMSYYLWEATGISFKDQISEQIEQALRDYEEARSKRLDYKTDIVEKFVNNKDQ